MRPIIEILGLLRRNLPLVILLVVASLGVAVWQIRREAPRYRTTAVIRLVDKSRALSGGLGGGVGNVALGQGADALLSQIQLLQSRTVARDVAARAGLRLRAATREFPRGLVDSVVVGDDAANDSIGLRFTGREFVARFRGREQRAPYGGVVTINATRFTVQRRPALDAAQLVVVPATAAIGEVLEGLRGRPRERTDIVDVGFTGSDPVMVQRVANATVAVFEELSSRTAKQQSVRRRQFIEQQLRKSELLLSEAQEAHNKFRSREQVYSSQDKFRAQQSDVLALELRRQELDADRRVYARLLAELRAPSAGRTAAEAIGALVSAPGVAGNPVVSQLYAQLSGLQASRDSLTTGTWARTPDHPDVRRTDTLLAQTQAKIVAAVNGQIAGVEARIGAIDELRSRAAGQLAVLPGTEAEEASLLAQLETYRREVERLRDESQKAQIDEAAETGQVEVVDLATVGAPIGSGPVPRIVLALLVGAALGLAGAYLREQRNHAIRRRDDLDFVVEAPNLAFVPPIRTGRKLARGGGAGAGRLAATNGKTGVLSQELVLAGNAQSLGAEAYRTLRTNLLFSASLQNLRRVVVTSAGPSEGKTITAANLGVAFAQQGHRVLLIDADLRRPRLFAAFGQSRSPGLTDVVGGREEVGKAIRSSHDERLFLLPPGSSVSNPAELLGSAGMHELLERLSAQFDLIILDTPPLLAASDAAIAARLTDGAVLVVRAGLTEPGAVHEAVVQLTNVGARLLGTVLNDPDATVAKYARYSGHYYAGYYDYSTPTR